MSPASTSKSKDKKAGKDPQKVSLKPSGLGNMVGGTSISGYNPLLGKFHTVETTPFTSASSLQVNCRFRNIDETDDNSGSNAGNVLEIDSLSNNGSWSGESEDHKDKLNSLRQKVIPGADSDKSEKIRQKNERKHQRQKERRALELHDRCNGFLMSRKLEVLTQQLVVMGFTQERATMGLILNEGKIEESVAWLLEGGEEAADTLKEHQNLEGGILKIDISEELARIADMEIRYKCSKQEVERAIVTSEGDLDKAAGTLRVQKQNSPSASPKPYETGDPPTLCNDKISLSNSNNSLRIQLKATSTLSQQKREDNDLTCTKTVAANGVAVGPGSQPVQMLRKQPSKLESAKPQPIITAVDKQWPPAAANNSVSYSLSSSLQATQSQVKAEVVCRPVLDSELKNLQLGSLKEPVKLMPRPQSGNLKQVRATTISSSPPNPAPVEGWYPNNGELVRPNGLPNGISSHIVPNTRSLVSPNSLNASDQLYSQTHYQQHNPQYVSNNDGMMVSLGASRVNGLWNRMNGSSQNLGAASSLGLFSGRISNGSSGSLSVVDWKSGGSIGHLDYANIDWSLDRSSKPTNGMWNPNNFHGHDMYATGPGARTVMRPLLMANSGSGFGLVGMRDGVVVDTSGESSTAGAREWSSPFEERDLFSLPRQFVSSSSSSSPSSSSPSSAL